ncbi:hypothetical protein NQ317_012388, partial [Molorchus minor]
FFDEDVCDTNNLNSPRHTEEIINTPTAPKNSRFHFSYRSMPEAAPGIIKLNQVHQVNPLIIKGNDVTSFGVFDKKRFLVSVVTTPLVAVQIQGSPPREISHHRGETSWVINILIFLCSKAISRNSIPDSPQIKSEAPLETISIQTIESDNYTYSFNTNNGNVEEYKTTTEEKLSNILDHNLNNNPSPRKVIKNTPNNLYNIDTTDLVLVDNATNNIIKLEHFKKVDLFSNIDDNFNTSTNSLNSENLSSPMQTSTDVYLDSEILSTDLASNDSQSPKNLQTEANVKKANFDYETNIIEVEKVSEFFSKPKIYLSNESLSNPKSDQSLLDSADTQQGVQKTEETQKKYFGVKTLQNIFTKRDGYSDISTTASELGDDPFPQEKPVIKPKEVDSKLAPADNNVCVYKNNPTYAPETSPQFEENIHNLLSDIFIKSFTSNSEVNASNVSMSKPIGSKKYFSLHGQNLRVGKALRLCPNDDYTDSVENTQRKEKLLGEVRL